MLRAITPLRNIKVFDGVNSGIPPQVGRYKVFIIDEVLSAVNDGLQCFPEDTEELPCQGVIFYILATTEKLKGFSPLICLVVRFMTLKKNDL